MSQLSPTELLAQLQALVSSPPQSLIQDTNLRSQLYHAAREAMISLEDAAGPITRVAVAQPAEWVTMRVCCEMGLYPALMAEGGKPKTLGQLVEMTGADATLLLRFLRASVCFGAVREAGPQTYVLSASYAQLGDPKVAAAMPKFADFVHATFYATPRLLADTHYQNPRDPLNTAMQLAFNAPNKAPYEIFGSMPENAKAIGTLLSAMGVRKSQRIEAVYPIRERLVAGFDSTTQDVLFVDIGAGNGHMAAGLRSAMPDLPGRIIAQDLPGMIASAPSSPAGIEMQSYDFFTEQPVKRARAYYIRLCLHNWQDEDCISILTRIRQAMKPGYSRLIVHEQVTPEHGTHPWAAVSDISQMGACASGERTEREWDQLLRKAGLEKPKLYWPTDPSSEVAMESEVKV